jgi:hypothetical protein
MGQFNIREMPERASQQLEDLGAWTGYTKTQLVLIAIDRLWIETNADRNMRLSPPKEHGYIEIRLRPDQMDLQDQIKERCQGVWFPTPREPYSGTCIIGVSAQTDTAILDELGVEYSFK